MNINRMKSWEVKRIRNAYMKGKEELIAFLNAIEIDLTARLLLLLAELRSHCYYI